MNVDELLAEAYDRLPGLVRSVLDGLTPEDLYWQPVPGVNPIGWLVWHLTRVQDHHIADILDTGQVWASGDWAVHCGLVADPTDTGYGHSPEQVAAVRPDSAGILLGYYLAVAARTQDFLVGLAPTDLDRVVDRRWTPPVTLGVRLVSVLGDTTQHVGQAAYVRGLRYG
jgi:hypothetical protein